MNKLRVWIALVLGLPLLLMVAPAEAKEVYVENAKGSDMSEAQLETVTSLIRAAAAELTDIELSENTSAEWRLAPTVMRLGNSYILSLTKSVAGKKRYSAKLKATSFEDMDTVTTRLVRAVLYEQSVANNAQVDDVTADEVEGRNRRRETTRQWTFGFRPAYPTNLNTESDGLNWSIGYVWGVDYQFDIQLFFDWLSMKDEDDAHFWNTSIGVNYYLTKANIAPYLTVDFGYGGAAASDGSIILSDDRASGLVVGGGAGLKFFRTSAVNLGLQVRYAQMFDETSKGNPGVTQIRVGVYF